jgi:hypothetical protein
VLGEVVVAAQRLITAGNNPDRVDPVGQGLDLAAQIAMPVGQDLQRGQGVGDDRIGEQATAAQQ